MSVKTCSDTTEAIALEPSLGLYLKPVSKIKINVQLPKLTVPGQSISSWHVMEKLKATVRPDSFLYLKALKITSNVIKFEGELETKASCERALARLRAAGSLKLSGFAEKLQIRAAHAACSGPTRHDWEAFFRDAKGVNEMKPGERPDTVHLEEMPVRWFAESSKSMKPSEKLLRKAFGSFGKIRRLEIPRNVLSETNTFRKTSILHSDLLFEAYIQYEEYVEFSIAMDSLRGKKLLYKEPDGNVYMADIKVDFDRTNYLSDKCIRKREAEAKTLHHISSPEREKRFSVEDKHKDVTIIKPKIVPESSLTIGKTTSKVEQYLSDKNIPIKEKADQQRLEEEKNSQKEARLLLKELLRRAEIHERKMEEKRKHIKICPIQINKIGEKQDSINSHKKTITKDSVVKTELKLAKELERNRLGKQKEMNNIFNSENSQKSNKRKFTKASEEEQESKQAFHVNKKRDVVESKKERTGSGTVAGHREKSKDKGILLHHNKTKNKKEKSAIDCKGKKEKDTFYYEEKKMKESLEKVYDEDRKNKEKLILQERILKEKLLQKLKARQEEKLRLREKLRKELAGRKVLKSVLGDTNCSMHRKK